MDFILICDVSGSGKSTVSQFLSDRLGYERIVGDQIRHTVLKIAHLPGDEQSKILEKYALNHLHQCSQEKKSLIIDAVFALQSQRNVFIHKAQELGYTVSIIKVVNPNTVLVKKRITERVADDIIQFSRGGLADYERTLDAREEIMQDHITICNDKNVESLYASLTQYVLPLFHRYEMKKEKITDTNDRPFLLHIIGLVGTGKSTARKYLSQKLSLPAVNTDQIQKSLFPDPQYTDEEFLLVSHIFEKEILGHIAKKSSLIVEGYSTRQEKRDIIKNLCDEYGYRYLPLCIQADEQGLRERIEQRFAQEDRDSDGDWNVYMRIKDEFSPLQNDVTVIENNGTQHAFFEKLDAFLLGKTGYRPSGTSPD